MAAITDCQGRLVPPLMCFHLFSCPLAILGILLRAGLVALCMTTWSHSWDSYKCSSLSAGKDSKTCPSPAEVRMCWRFPRDLSHLRIMSKVLSEEPDPRKRLGKAGTTLSSVPGSSLSWIILPSARRVKAASSKYCHLLPAGAGSCLPVPPGVSAPVGDPVWHFQRCLLLQLDAN